MMHWKVGPTKAPWSQSLWHGPDEQVDVVNRIVQFRKFIHNLLSISSHITFVNVNLARAQTYRRGNQIKKVAELAGRWQTTLGPIGVIAGNTYITKCYYISLMERRIVNRKKYHDHDRVGG